jgi:DNA-binding NtrC family response regulator
MTKILILDDDVQLCNMLSNYLHERYTIICAYDLTNAYKIILQKPFRVHLVDNFIDDCIRNEGNP